MLRCCNAFGLSRNHRFPQLASPRERVHVAVHKRWKRPFGKAGQARSGKDKQVYQSQLSHEAKLIVRGQRDWVRDFAVFWARIIAWLSIRSTKALAVVTQFR